MSWTNPVIWQEGMFLRAQHFQQQDRWLEALVRERTAMLRPHGWGMAEYRPRNSTKPIFFPTNYPYSAQVHRQMQLAANIYDASVNTFFIDPINRIAAPTVFRPLLYEDTRTPGVLRLHSFEQITNITIAGILSRAWTSPDRITNSAPRDISSPASTLTPSAPEAAVTTRNIEIGRAHV